MADFLTVGGFVCRVVEGSATERPSLYQGGRLRMKANNVIDTQDPATRKRVLDCQIDLYSHEEEDELRTACPVGEAVPVAGDWPGTGFDGLVDIGDIPVLTQDEADSEVWNTVSLHIEEA